MSEDTILISGATGRTGGAAIDTLLQMGRSVRAYLRKDDERAAAFRARGVDIAIGDFTDLDAIRAAMEKVRGAYFLHPISPGILSASAYFAQAAKEAGVGAIVNMSQISARREATSHAAQDHWMSERIFDWSGVPTTHLRPTFFADWLVYPHFAKEIGARHRIEFPFGNGRHAPISSEDLGRVIAHVLAHPADHAGKTYPLHGPIELDHHEIAAKMSGALGMPLAYVPISVEHFQRQMEQDYKFGPFLVQHLCEVAQDYQRGVFAGTNDNVEKITGSPPAHGRAGHPAASRRFPQLGEFSTHLVGYLMMLHGKRALVTGASRGIGAAIAKALAAEGADVAITYEKSAEAAAAVVGNLKALGRQAHAMQADNADPDAVKASVEEAVRVLGGLDILVNNAGIIRFSTLEDMSVADVDALLAINIRAPILASRTAISYLGNGGRIINIGSYFADHVPPGAGLTVYALTKSAMTAFTKGLAREVGARGITVNVVQPGSIDTDMNPSAGPFSDALRAITALGRYGTVDEIADAVVFLAGPRARYVTGATLTVDGGANA